MSPVISAALAYHASWFQSRHAMHLEILALSPPTWRAFLNNHGKDIGACDFFTVPAVTFRVLSVFLILAHDRRRLVHINVTDHPTASWPTQQMVAAFPWQTAGHLSNIDQPEAFNKAVLEFLARH